MEASRAALELFSKAGLVVSFLTFPWDVFVGDLGWFFFLPKAVGSIHFIKKSATEVIKG